MVRYSLSILLLLTYFVSAQNYFETNVDSLWQLGIKQTIKQEYESCDSTFQQLKIEYPSLPLGDIYLANYRISKSLDFEEEFEYDIIEGHFNRALEICDSLLETNENDIWFNNFKGLTETSFAYYNALIGNYFSAFDHGMTAAEYYEKCIDKDPLFYEAYYIFGAFKFWKSAKSDLIDWLPFINDETQEGIRLLETVYERSNYSRYVAAENLVWAYYEKMDTLKSINHCENLLNEFPNSRYFMVTAGRLYTGFDDRKAIDYYSKALESIMQINGLNRIKEIILKHKIAMLYEQVGEFELALNYCNDILEISKSENDSFYKVEERFDRTVQLRNTLIEKMNSQVYHD